MKRQERSDEEFTQKLRGDSQLLALFDALKSDERLTIQADGTGSCVFKVYLRGQTGPKEGFLRAMTPLDQSYVDWYQQSTECRDAFTSIVKRDTNKDGSQLRSGVSLDEVVQAVLRFAESVEPRTA